MNHWHDLASDVFIYIWFWWKLLTVITPQLFLKEEVFALKIINLNLEYMFYFLFSNLVCKDISMQASRRVLPKLSENFAVIFHLISLCPTVGSML